MLSAHLLRCHGDIKFKNTHHISSKKAGRRGELYHIILDYGQVHILWTYQKAKIKCRPLDYFWPACVALITNCHLY